MIMDAVLERDEALVSRQPALCPASPARQHAGQATTLPHDAEQELVLVLACSRGSLGVGFHGRGKQMCMLVQIQVCFTCDLTNKTTPTRRHVIKALHPARSL